jgi:tetratricopeptide (TPR) repeat protein
VDFGPDLKTTSGALAISNLEAQIAGWEARLSLGGCSAAEHAELIELVALRGQLLGHIADYESAEERALELYRTRSDDGYAHLARARARARFHRFKEALTNLDAAERLGTGHELIEQERAAILQAIGEFDQALAILGRAAEARRDFASLGGLAVLHAERGDYEAAEHFFRDSRAAYRGVSPIPLAMLEFQFGHMWMSKGDLTEARGWFEKAVARLPCYAPAAGHLAEIEAEIGDYEGAIDRLRALAVSCDDPDYSASLARLLAGPNEEEARFWRERAAARYEELLERRPEAYADHAAAFWMEAGNDPDRALALARANLDLRNTPRAQELHRRAMLAAEVAHAV